MPDSSPIPTDSEKSGLPQEKLSVVLEKNRAERHAVAASVLQDVSKKIFGLNESQTVIFQSLYDAHEAAKKKLLTAVLDGNEDFARELAASPIDTAGELLLSIEEIATANPNIQDEAVKDLLNTVTTHPKLPELKKLQEEKSSLMVRVLEVAKRAAAALGK